MQIRRGRVMLTVRRALRSARTRRTGREMPLSSSIAGARDARAAELLNEADPARSARGFGFASPPAARRSLRLLRTLGGRLISRPVRALRRGRRPAVSDPLSSGI